MALDGCEKRAHGILLQDNNKKAGYPHLGIRKPGYIHIHVKVSSCSSPRLEYRSDTWGHVLLVWLSWSLTFSCQFGCYLACYQPVQLGLRYQLTSYSQSIQDPPPPPHTHTPTPSVCVSETLCVSVGSPPPLSLVSHLQVV